MEMWHMSGAGNDFAVIDARGKALDFEKLTLELCQKLDCDGFMALDYSETADFKLHFYNRDGMRGEMCGNGARCICRFAYDLGIAGETMVVETDAGPVPGWRLAEGMYRIKMNNPTTLDPDRKPGIAYVELGQPGSPHAVTELPGLEWEQREALRQRAAALRKDPAFPKGANVTFHTWLDETTVRVLTYERGVEDYTLACGTGCCSTAATLWKLGRIPGGKLTCLNPGGKLQVEVSGEEGAVTSLLLTGPAEVIKVYEI